MWVWDAVPGQEVRTLQGHTRLVHSVAFIPDSRPLVSASYDQTVRVWDAATGQLARTLKGHTSSVMSVAFSPDGQRLASAGWDKTVRVWDAATGKPIAEPLGHEGVLLCRGLQPGRQDFPHGRSPSRSALGRDLSLGIQAVAGLYSPIDLLAYLDNLPTTTRES